MENKKGGCPCSLWSSEELKMSHFCISNYLITECEVFTGKAQTETLPYLPNDSSVNTVGRGLRFSRDDRTVEVVKLFIIWLMN